MNTNQLIKFINENSEKRQGLLNLFSIDNAIKAIEIAKQNEINVLGIDAFRITDTTICPFMEHSIDYSEKKNIFDDAISFIKERKDMNFLFEITFDF